VIANCVDLQEVMGSSPRGRKMKFEEQDSHLSKKIILNLLGIYLFDPSSKKPFWDEDAF
jgi:hypothetical protein